MNTLPLGRVDRVYKPFCWFGRPIALLHVAQGTRSNEDLFGTLDQALAMGFDGFVFGTTNDAKDRLLGEIISQLASRYASVCFVGLEVADSDCARHVWSLVEGLNFRKGYSFFSPQPGTLRDLFVVNNQVEIVLQVDRDPEFEGLERCPYTGVEIAEGIATHNRIMSISISLKSVFVRVPKTWTANKPNRFARRIRFLHHEKVDAIIYPDLESHRVGEEKAPQH